MGLMCFCPFSIQRRWQLLFCAVLSRMVVGHTAWEKRDSILFLESRFVSWQSQQNSVLLGQTLGRWASGPLRSLGLSLTQDSSAGTQTPPVPGIPLDAPLCHPPPGRRGVGGYGAVDWPRPRLPVVPWEIESLSDPGGLSFLLTPNKTVTGQLISFASRATVLDIWKHLQAKVFQSHPTSILCLRKREEHQKYRRHQATLEISAVFRRHQVPERKGSFSPPPWLGEEQVWWGRGRNGGS